MQLQRRSSLAMDVCPKGLLLVFCVIVGVYCTLYVVRSTRVRRRKSVDCNIE